MFTTFSSVPLSPPPADVLWEVQEILDARDITFGTLVANALRDTTTSLGATVVSDLANILEALRPHLDKDEKARMLFGQFFASIASLELLQFEKGDGETSWKLPATNLSVAQLMEFSLEEMGKRIASDAPGLSSFLSGICGGGKLGDCEVDDEMGEGDTEGDAGDNAEFGAEAKRKVSPARLLEIVSLLACCIFMAHTANRERLPSRVSS